ncbi:MAG: hypothetical protein ACR2NA_14335 [Solirubrobacterales bacterium]
MKSLRIFVLIALATLALPAAASARSTQETIFQDDAAILASDEAGQEATLLELQALGVDAVRVNVIWKQYVPGTGNESSRPSGDPRDPSWYPEAKWARLDRFVQRATALRMQVLFSPAAAAETASSSRLGLPKWARNRDGSPKDVEFERYVHALAKRYNGTYRGADGTLLPRVRRWSVWNEPNQGGWLQPQWKKVKGRNIAYSPVTYRKLFTRARKSLRRTSGHSSSAIYAGELAPIGREGSRRTKTSPISPGLFLREMTCLDSRYRAYRGGDKSRRSNCSGAKFTTNGLAIHPYTKGNRTNATTKHGRDEFPTGDLRGLTRMLDRIARTRRLPKRLRVYNTEFGFQTNPPDKPAGVSPSRQAQYENEAEYIHYRNSRVFSFNHYLMYDDRCGGSRCGGFQTGLRYYQAESRRGAFKPAYEAFRMPIVVTSTSRTTRMRVWGAALGRGRRDVWIYNLSTKKVVKKLSASKTSRRGYFNVTVSGKRNHRFQLIDPTTKTTSRSARRSSSKVR